MEEQRLCRLLEERAPRESSRNSPLAAGVEPVMDRQTVRDTAGRMFRSDDLAVNEKQDAKEFLTANPAIGNPHMVRCSWCHQTRMLFRDEDRDTFTRTAHGWRCTDCNEHASSQEVRF